MPHRIAFVTGSFVPGGTEHFLVRMLRNLDRERFTPYVVTLEDTGELREVAHELASVYAANLTGKLFNYRGVSEMLRLRRWLIEQEIDLVHVLMDRPSIFGAIASRLAHDLPLVGSHRYTVLPIGPVLRLIYVLIMRFLADHVIPNSNAAVPWLERRGIPRSRITVIHNGIPQERFRPVVERPADPSPVTICSVGRFRPDKGQHVLIQALPELMKDEKAVRVVLVGTGPQEEYLRALAGQLGVDGAIEWTGFLDDPIETIRQSDICVLTSDNEGFPNAVVEYLAAGRPVVATAVGGVPEMVKPEKTGLLVPFGDVPALVQALRRLIADGDLRRRMGRSGRELVEAELTAAKEVDQTQAVYQRVLDARRTM